MRDTLVSRSRIAFRNVIFAKFNKAEEIWTERTKERKNLLLFFLSAPNFLPHLTGGTPRRCPCPLSPRHTLPASPTGCPCHFNVLEYA